MFSLELTSYHLFLYSFSSKKWFDPRQLYRVRSFSAAPQRTQISTQIHLTELGFTTLHQKSKHRVHGEEMRWQKMEPVGSPRCREGPPAAGGLDARRRAVAGAAAQTQRERDVSAVLSRRRHRAVSKLPLPPK